jgi:hypothetical protein
MDADRVFIDPDESRPNDELPLSVRLLFPHTTIKLLPPLTM